MYPSTATETTYSPGSPSYDRSNARGQHVDPIQHATIRQILTAAHTETHFKIDGRTTGFVKLVANVYMHDFAEGRIKFGLDDGTGRIRATKWIVEGGDEERELAELGSEQFRYARVVGTIAEFGGTHYLIVIKIDRVEDPHEIYHHLLSIMVESLMLQRGPPGPAVVPSAMPATQTAEPFSLGSLKYSLPSPAPVSRTRDLGTSEEESSMISGTPPLHAPLHERPVTPVQQTAGMFTPPRQDATESPDDSPISVRIIDGDTSRSYRFGGDPSSPGSSREPVSPSPAVRRWRPSSRPSLAPGRLLRSPAQQTTTSTVEVSHYQASPQFIPPVDSSRTSSHGYERRKPVYEQRGTIPQQPYDLAPQTPVRARMSTSTNTRLRRDPYSHLSNLQREIILTIQNILLEIEGTESGVHISMIVDSIARRRRGFDKDDFGEAFTSLVNEGFIYSTIDDRHFACTV